MKQIEVRDGAFRFAPENTGETALLATHIQMALPDWKPILNLHGAQPSGLDFRLELQSDRVQDDGLFEGYLHTRRADFDPATLLGGEAVPATLWVEWSEYWGDKTPRVCWSVEASTHGEAQENYLPHLPVLMAE